MNSGDELGCGRRSGVADRTLELVVSVPLTVSTIPGAAATDIGDVSKLELSLTSKLLGKLIVGPGALGSNGPRETGHGFSIFDGIRQGVNDRPLS